MKKDIALLPKVLPRVLRLQPSSYHFKNDVSKQDCIGFIVQDVKTLFHELVDVRMTENKDIPDLHGMNYSGLGVIAIKAIQVQQEIIFQLQNEVAE